MTHITCRLTAKNRDQLRNPALGSRVWATFTFLIRNIILEDEFTGLRWPEVIETDRAGAYRYAAIGATRFEITAADPV